MEHCIGAIEKLFEYRGVVSLTGRELKVKRMPVPVAENVDFGSKPAARTA